MPGPLAHSPAQVVANLLVSLGLATSPADSPGAWPSYAFNEPHIPDDCITVYDTAGLLTATIQVDGEQQGDEGIQVRIRSNVPNEGWAKADAIAKALDPVHNRQTQVGATVYLVATMKRSSGPFSIGRDKPGSGRTIHTINYLACIRQR